MNLYAEKLPTGGICLEAVYKHGASPAHLNTVRVSPNRRIMAFKLLALAAVVALANAGYVPTHGYAAAPVQYASYAPVAKVVAVEHHAPAAYSFEYGVSDPHTGDVKAQHETREGGVVKGYYTLNDADGTKRTVHYTADDVHGFNAVVQREGTPVHPVTVPKVHAPVVKVVKAVHVAPVHYAQAAPVHYAQAAPVAYAQAAAPLGYAHTAQIGYANAGPVGYTSHAVHAAPAHYATHAVPIGYATQAAYGHY